MSTKTYRYQRQTPCIYEKIKVVFHGIPKNASTSIKSMLYKLEHGNEFSGENKQFIHKGNHKGGSIYPEVETIPSYKNADGWLHISVVRNPYERFCSFYNDLVLRSASFRTGTPSFYIDNHIDILNLTVNQTLDMIEQYNDSEADEHFVSQYQYIHSDECEFLHVESLKEEFERFCSENNFQILELKQMNKSLEDLVLTEEQKNRVYKRYEKDFIKFGYQK